MEVGWRKVGARRLQRSGLGAAIGRGMRFLPAHPPTPQSCRPMRRTTSVNLDLGGLPICWAVNLDCGRAKSVDRDDRSSGKQNPGGKYSYGSAGFGARRSIVGEMFSRCGQTVDHPGNVPYSGSGAGRTQGLWPARSIMWFEKHPRPPLIPKKVSRAGPRWRPLRRPPLPSARVAAHEIPALARRWPGPGHHSRDHLTAPRKLPPGGHHRGLGHRACRRKALEARTSRPNNAICIGTGVVG